MILISLPDCKKVHAQLTLGKDYKILGELGNGYKIELDDGKDMILILKERFK